jgi:hypothetical protein
MTVAFTQETLGNAGNAALKDGRFHSPYGGIGKWKRTVSERRQRQR